MSLSTDTVVEISSNEGFLLNLPSDILVEILCRLLAIDLINCKAVCKKLLNILSTPKFAELHLSRSKRCLFTLQYEVPKTFCRIFEFGDENHPYNLCDDPVIEFDFLPFGCRGNAYCCTELVSSINGLVCFYRRRQEILCVWNPITREYVTLPGVRSFGEHPQTIAYGFGASTTSGQYKVVSICQTWGRDATGRRILGRIKMSVCYVYTLGTGSWRRIDGAPIMYDYGGNLYRDGTLFNGNLHWLIKDLEGSELISCFDLEKESFLPFPPPFSSKQPMPDLLTLGVVTGCLCLCDNTSEYDIIIWVMKEYGVKKSWTKDFVINKMCSFHPVLERSKVTVLEISKDGDILFLMNKIEVLFTYNNESRNLQWINCSQAMLHVSSIISLNAFEPEKVMMF